ncbi:hypothetical protein EATG_03830 [Escherichia coli H605]|uniref:Uncharacterized protein n=1 Tax=Escherichia coli H605 TaxID=656410 RepID=A0AAJ3NW57_ECOLX|nr:hypothetical protein EATG_03830 [Escherichia coli H605]
MYSFFNTHNPSPTIENTLLFFTTGARFVIFIHSSETFIY